MADVGIVCDLREEQWVSMDLVADELLAAGQQIEGEFRLRRIQPEFRRRFSSSGAGPYTEPRTARLRFTMDRTLNRFLDYPGHLRRVRGRYDLFHVIDQAYANLVHSLPADRTVVTCHDLHAFGSLLDDTAPNRSWLFRQAARRVLSGLSSAARVVADTEAVKLALLEQGIVSEERLRVVPLGVDPRFVDTPDASADGAAARIAGSDGVPYLLHVGGTFERKRIDLVLRIFAAVRRCGEIRLVRVGGPLTASQVELSSQLGVKDAVSTAPRVDVPTLAALYRGAALTFLPSAEEGFGLPVIESMRCGTPVVASDLSVLREVGGSAATYCPVGDIGTWTETVVGLLQERTSSSDAWTARKKVALEWSSRYSWPRYLAGMTEIYRELNV